MAKRSTSTSAFGVSKRENHDASGFYRRFTPPEVSSDENVADYRAVDKLIVGDSRHMDEIPDSSVALVVTSPPYFAGKEYETILSDSNRLAVGGVPVTYLEYLGLLRDVFAECVKKLEPGGRIAVNVANLGRRPYRSLSADVIGILQDDLRLLLRGEIIWVKQRGSSGSCAWGSFQRASNPVLRDLTERVIVASKGRFDRAIATKVRDRRRLPSESSMTRDSFMENTVDVWEIPAESATRVGHPAPFPVELPARLIDLYTYREDIVLDPFCGSGTVAVAALRAGRHFAGYDLDESYIRLAETRVTQTREQIVAEASDSQPEIRLPAIPASTGNGEGRLSQAVSEGRSAREIGGLVIELAGFTGIQKDRCQNGGVDVDFVGEDSRGNTWLFDVVGSFTGQRSGLVRGDMLWKALGKACVLHEAGIAPFILLVTDLPRQGAGAKALKAVVGAKKPIYAVVEMLKHSGLSELRAYYEGQVPA